MQPIMVSIAETYSKNSLAIHNFVETPSIFSDIWRKKPYAFLCHLFGFKKPTIYKK